MNENVATKQDIAAVQKDIEALRLATQKDIESLRAETQQSFAAVHKDMQLQSSQLTVRMGGMLMATVGVLVGLQTLAGIFAGG